ncbi:hypothetical protein caldi_02810 [Caldinitratiruptor microaerophilus]|uniref:Uncharacterized protein n=1 Tax=Caldinitratiruptor microaerophilus TaxID=671077 RepID=A0AA35G5D5_9FIRM|nr:hypothetical protein caldi_02810 [Caldinitratiruptor microaerophilus]
MIGARPSPRYGEMGQWDGGVVVQKLHLDPCAAAFEALHGGQSAFLGPHLGCSQCKLSRSTASRAGTWTSGVRPPGTPAGWAPPKRQRGRGGPLCRYGFSR